MVWVPQVSKMRSSLEDALTSVDKTYAELVAIANDIVNPCLKEIDKIMKEAYDNIHELSNDDIRHMIIALSLKSYAFSSIKEKSSLKAECAEALRKEAYAIEYNKAEGAVAARDNNATIEISNEILTECVYNLVADMLKTKLDECHRVVDSLKTVLMSRMAEAKLANNLDE